MARNRGDKRISPSAPVIRLARPDRGAPSEDTLLRLAQERGLFEQAEQRNREAGEKKRREKEEKKEKGEGGGENESGDGEESEDDEEDEETEKGLSPGADRLMDAVLWGTTIAVGHFAFDVLVQRQFSVEFSWSTVVWRAVKTFPVFFFLFYVLHPHPSSPTLLPGLPLRFQRALRQAIFFVASVATGCYLIHVSNRHAYLYVMKRSPTLGCLWMWSVVELELAPACVSVLVSAAFFAQGGYGIR